MAIAIPDVALAHTPAPVPPGGLWASWDLDPWVVLPLLLVWWLYGRGLAALWGRAGVGRGVARARAAAFALGWFALAAALVSPLDHMAGELASAHMVQHMLLLAVAPPLLLFGEPGAALLWALPARWRGQVGGRLPRAAPVRVAWGWLGSPAVAAALFGAAVWLWHAPAPYQAALASEAVHALEHGTLLAAGLLYWHRLLAPLRGTDAGTGYGGATLSALLTMMHTGLLAAVMTFARKPWYPLYGARPEAWGLTPLQDQQLAGVLMWVPMGLVFLLAGLWLMARWLRLAERGG